MANHEGTSAISEMTAGILYLSGAKSARKNLCTVEIAISFELKSAPTQGVVLKRT